MKHLLLMLTCILSLTESLLAQGCVAIRNISGFSQYLQSENAYSTSSWLLNANNRYFTSFRDFRGAEDLKTAPENESITKSYTLDLSLTHLMNRGWSVSLAIPILANAREASLEHGGPNTERFTTHAFGLGDIRLIASKWILPLDVSRKGNFQLGLGLKFPTGDYKYADYFHRNGTAVLAPVNPGIQIGDGGLGLISELNAYYSITEGISVYADLYYLANPREQNSVSVMGGRTPSEFQIQARTDVTSVTDVYSLRGGVYVDVLPQFTLSAGVRNEGLPVKDLIGGSLGTRRPGHNLSVEPGFILRSEKFSVYGYVPVIVSRTIEQGESDKLLSELTGTTVYSPGGSGNYQIFFGILFKL